MYEWRKDGRGEIWSRKNDRGNLVARKIGREENWSLGNIVIYFCCFEY